MDESRPGSADGPLQQDADGRRRPGLWLPLVIMLVPVPIGAAMSALSELFKTPRPHSGQDFAGAYDFVLPLLATTMVALVCTIVALPLTLRARPSPLRWVLLALEIAVAIGVALFGLWLFG